MCCPSSRVQGERGEQGRGNQYWMQVGVASLCSVSRGRLQNPQNKSQNILWGKEGCHLFIPL